MVSRSPRGTATLSPTGKSLWIAFWPQLLVLGLLWSDVPTMQRWFLRPWSWNRTQSHGIKLMRTHITFNCHGDANMEVTIIPSIALIHINPTVTLKCFIDR